MSVDGIVGNEVTTFLKWVADQLSAKWDKAYGSVMGWIRTSLYFAILRATLLCMYLGCHTKWDSLGIADWESIDVSIHVSYFVY